VKAAYEAGQLHLPEALQEGSCFQALLDRLYGKIWVVYSKPPFGSPQQVLAYLARYTHRVAISNHRLVGLEGGRVSFTYKDYTQGGRTREMPLPVEEFMRRFLLHVLPEGFVRIRYYGLLANRSRERNLARCRELLAAPSPAELSAAVPQEEGWQARLTRLTGTDPTLGPQCGRGHLCRIEELAPVASGSAPRSPP
jgi:putative transposase